ncbi:MAG: hypothetical protein AB1705_13080 [Verrucomicrobiota bacterium]
MKATPITFALGSTGVVPRHVAPTNESGNRDCIAPRYQSGAEFQPTTAQLIGTLWTSHEEKVELSRDGHRRRRFPHMRMQAKLAPDGFGQFAGFDPTRVVIPEGDHSILCHNEKHPTPLGLAPKHCQ